MTSAELEASRWIARLEAADVTLEDHQRFRAWLEAAPENRPAYQAVAASFDRLDKLKLLTPKPATSLPRPTLSRRALFVGGAGAAAVAGAGALGLWTLTPATTFAATYETPIGGRQHATLSDGSGIELNADTRLRAAFTGQARTLHLERGEALFTVAADPRPFIVRTRFGALTAQGTVFLVKLTGAAARVSVLAGHVTGEHAASASGQASVHQELVLSAHGVAQHNLSAERTSQRLAWRTHMLAFDGETLAEAAADVEAQTGIRFRFADPAIAALRVGGYIDARDARAFITLLETNLGLSARRQGDGSILLDT
ncbi:MAG: FecR domain-containing protein [Hyphomonadaceae bacterium]|nr:FecR domain-containing protein [Hyphomonadaceae bacterium]